MINLSPDCKKLKELKHQKHRTTTHESYNTGDAFEYDRL